MHTIAKGHRFGGTAYRVFACFLGDDLCSFWSVYAESLDTVTPYERGNETLKENLMQRFTGISREMNRVSSGIFVLALLVACMVLPVSTTASAATAVSTGNLSLAETTKQELIAELMPGVEIPKGEWWKAKKGAKVFPSSYDWRDVGGEDYITPVKYQNVCGTCGSFALTGSFEAMFKITMDNPFIQPDFSELHIFSCAGGTCTNGRVHAAMLNIMETNGIADETSCPISPGPLAAPTNAPIIRTGPSGCRLRKRRNTSTRRRSRTRS